MKNTITHKIVILIWVMKELFFYHKCFGMTTFLKWLLNPNKGGPNFLFWKKNVRYLRKMIFAFGRFRRRQHLSSSPRTTTPRNKLFMLNENNPLKVSSIFLEYKNHHNFSILHFINYISLILGQWPIIRTLSAYKQNN